MTNERDNFSKRSPTNFLLRLGTGTKTEAASPVGGEVENHPNIGFT